MKKYIFLLIAVIVFQSSCIKDRLQPVINANTTTNSDTLLHYWDFNGSDTSVHSTSFTLAGLSKGTFLYDANYIDFSAPGSMLNLQNNSTSGNFLRVRNPSNFIIFKVPSTGYKNIVFKFAEQRSNSGSTQNAIQYSTDGVNYKSTILGNNTYSVDTTFSLNTFSLAADTTANNNNLLSIKISFLNNNSGTSGNNRFDNVAIWGEKQ